MAHGVMLTIVVVGGLLFVAFGFQRGNEGRWFDRRFWPTVGNTVRFVASAVPSTTVVSLLLAVALNRERRVMVALRTVLFLS